MAIAIVDTRVSDECERRLRGYGYEVLRAPAFSRLSAPLASHPDMLMFYHGGKIITSADYNAEAEALFSDIRYLCPRVSVCFVDEVQGESYPRDAIFNALVIGNRLFARCESVCRAVTEYARECGLEVINVNQGYPACCALPLGSDSAITADKGLYRAFISHGVDATLIENGDILLPPYEYGFIGGAAGVHRGRVFFLGDVRTHRCADVILGAIERAGLVAVSLGDGPLSDLGRIIFVE
ncbi:MAG: hypothetical protein IJD51_03640 [Clostridia bacterium]|nr:hypothetical protein [Clostridia bacterium]